jgi:hypothetical protein
MHLMHGEAVRVIGGPAGVGGWPPAGKHRCIMVGLVTATNPCRFLDRLPPVQERTGYPSR